MMGNDEDWEPWRQLLEQHRGRRHPLRTAVRVIGLGMVIYGLLLIAATYVNAAQATNTWARLADCESGQWDAHAHPIAGTATWDDQRGGYEGGLHFTHSTWLAFRADDMPWNGAEASVFQQVWVAEHVLDAQGWGAWPVCSRKIGVRR